MSQAEGNTEQFAPGWLLRFPERYYIRQSDSIDFDTSGQYVLTFPDGRTSAAAGHGWEVDREACGFVCVNQSGPLPVPMNDFQDGRTLLQEYRVQHETVPAFAEYEDDPDGLAQAAESLNLDDNAEEQQPGRSVPKSDEEIMHDLISDPEFRRHMYVSHCTRGEVEDLKALCHRYPQDHLIGSVDEEGNTGALLAATEEVGLQALQWLIKKGASVQRANHFGRTPLMEATLWGRLATVRYLTQQGADLQSHDANGMRAVDFAAETERNKKERKVRANGFYRESSDADEKRRQIAAWLNNLAPTAPLEGSDSWSAVGQRRAFFDRKPDGKLEVYRPHTLLSPPSDKLGPQVQKAFATLDRGLSYPYVNVMSGYSHPNWPNVLDNELWTAKAERLRAFLGLPPDKSAASHVEPQLLAYLVDHHSLRPLDDWRDDSDLDDLRNVLPDQALKPLITVSKTKLCDKCDTFFEYFKSALPDFKVAFHCIGDTCAAPLQLRT